MILLQIGLILAVLFLVIKYKIHKIRQRAPECYHGHPFFEFLSGFFDKHTNPKLNVNKNKIPNKPCLFLMNHVDVSDPLFILQIIKMQKTPRKLTYVATTEYHKYAPLRKLLEEDECIFVKFAKIPDGVSAEQAKMNSNNLEKTSLSIAQKKLIKEYQKEKQLYSEQVINQMVDRMKSGYNVFIFPTGTFDHYKHKPEMLRAMKPGAAKAILKCIADKIDIDVVILKKLGVPNRYAGSFFWSLPYMLTGGSRKIKMTLEASIPIRYFNHPLIMNADNPMKIITALYASYMSTEDLQSRCNTQKLKIQPIVLTTEELEAVKKLKEIIKSDGHSDEHVKDPNCPNENKEFGYSVDINDNPFIAFK